MKNLVTILFFALSLNSYTTTDETSEVLLLKEESGGYVPPARQGWGHKITVFDDGRVVESYKANFASVWEDSSLGTLSPMVIAELRRDLGDIVAGELTFPSIPECADAPGTTFQGRNARGEMIEFGATIACRTGLLESFFQSYRFIKILEAIDMFIW